jgi:hypothetical protein
MNIKYFQRREKRQRNTKNPVPREVREVGKTAKTFLPFAFDLEYETFWDEDHRGRFIKYKCTIKNPIVESSLAKFITRYGINIVIFLDENREKRYEVYQYPYPTLVTEGNETLEDILMAFFSARVSAKVKYYERLLHALGKKK